MMDLIRRCKPTGDWQAGAKWAVLMVDLYGWPFVSRCYFSFPDKSRAFWVGVGDVLDMRP